MPKNNFSFEKRRKELEKKAKKEEKKQRKLEHASDPSSDEIPAEETGEAAAPVADDSSGQVSA